MTNKLIDGASRIFDTENTDDLPKSLQENLIKRDRGIRGKILGLFDCGKATLHLSEIWVGVYRKHGIELSKSSISSSLHYLVKRGELVRKERGYYAKAD